MTDAGNVWMVKWGEVIGNYECPMMRRWVLQSPVGSFRVHHFIRSDDARALHDHPWWFVTVPLTRGGYAEELECRVCGGDGLVAARGVDAAVLGAYYEARRKCWECGGTGRTWAHVASWRPHFRPALYKHAVHVGDRGCWTLIVTGRKLRRWGFWGLFRNARHRSLVFLESGEYFEKFGHAACED